MHGHCPTLAGPQAHTVIIQGKLWRYSCASSRLQKPNVCLNLQAERQKHLKAHAFWTSSANVTGRGRTSPTAAVQPPAPQPRVSSATALRRNFGAFGYLQPAVFIQAPAWTGSVGIRRPAVALYAQQAGTNEAVGGASPQASGSTPSTEPSVKSLYDEDTAQQKTLQAAAVAQARRGDAVGALQDLRALRARFPGNPHFIIAAAKVTEDSGDTAGARQLAAEAVAVKPLAACLQVRSQKGAPAYWRIIAAGRRHAVPALPGRVRETAESWEAP